MHTQGGGGEGRVEREERRRQLCSVCSILCSSGSLFPTYVCT